VAVKVSVSEPFQSAVGLMVAIPFSIETFTLLLPETLKLSSPSTLSTSLKAVFRSIVYGVKSSAKVWSAMLLSTTGVSFTAFTVTLTVASSVSAPSVTV